MATVNKPVNAGPFELFASTARTAASGNSSEFRFSATPGGLYAVLDVTVDASTSADKLDVFVQTKIDGANWLDVMHFTQHDGDAGAKRYIAKIQRDAAEADVEVLAALAESTVRNIVGTDLRARFAITDDSASASFTFSLTVRPL